MDPGQLQVLSIACLVNHNIYFFKFYYFFLSLSDDESMKDNISVEVLNAAKETLLQGLSDENQGLQ